MAKTKPKKVKAKKIKTSKFKVLMEKLKINPRLKKQIRLTFASVFLVTAIVVAAIPPGEIEATINIPTKAPNVWNTAGYDNRANAIYPSPNSIEYYDFLNKVNDYPDLSALVNGTFSLNDLSTSYTIRQINQADPNAGWMHIEEFYFREMPVTGLPGAAFIYRYNDALYTSTLRLTDRITLNYQYIFDQTNQKITVDDDYKAFINEKGPSSHVDRLYIYSYADFARARDNLPERQDVLWIRKYIENKGDFDGIDAIFREYDREKEAYDRENPSGPAFRLPPDDELRVRPIRRTLDSHPSEFDPDVDPLLPRFIPAMLGEFYCEIRIGVESGFHLVTVLFPGTPVNPLPSPSPAASPTPVASPMPSPAPSPSIGSAFGERLVIRDKNGRSDNNNANHIPNAACDVNGFLGVRGTSIVYGIADEVFKGLPIVTELILPPNIRYIGNSAFENAEALSKIDLFNVRYFGNRSFKSCRRITSINLGSVSKIGAEAFFDTGITNLEVEGGLDYIGMGAFASCRSLGSLNLLRIMNNAVIDDFAFFNAEALNNIQMSTATIKSIGFAAFGMAPNRPNVLQRVILPTGITGIDERTLGDCLFQNRNNLLEVTMPNEFGSGQTAAEIARIPSGMFRGCDNLKWVRFPSTPGGTGCGLASFLTENNGVINLNNTNQYRGELLFLDVQNPDFVVYGPGRSTIDQFALPRQSTWRAYTSVRDFIPYIYQASDGREHYEVSMDGVYVWGIEKDADGNGILTTCRLLDQNARNIRLVIPSRVGDIKVIGISSACLANTEQNRILRENIVEIIISDNSLTAIEEGTFRDLINLKRVTIGNSVQNIGSNAFANCRELEEITLNRPNFDYRGNGFILGENAFKTNSDRLIINGVIDVDYKPFVFAVGNVTKVPVIEPQTINDRGTLVMYRSIDADKMVVMYDSNFGEVVLLDYPKFNELDDQNATYIENRIRELYEEYSHVRYDAERMRFMAAYYRIFFETEDGSGNLNSPLKEPLEIRTGHFDNSNPSAVKLNTAGNEALLALYRQNGSDGITPNPIYGPWMSQLFINSQLIPPNPNDDLNDVNILFNTNLHSYYSEKTKPRNIYSIRANYDRSMDTTKSYPPWLVVNTRDLALVLATKHINIPEGITSIDARAFLLDRGGQNLVNILAYFRGDNSTLSKESMDMVMSNFGDNNIYPGLFSGVYDAKFNNNGNNGGNNSGGNGEGDDIDTPLSTTANIRDKRGNQDIISISMSSVRKLPDYAFDNCRNLEYVVMGSALTDIGTLPFYDTRALRRVVGNAHFPVENGIIYSILKRDLEDEPIELKIEQVVSNRGNSIPSEFLDRLNIFYYRRNIDEVINTLNDPMIALVSEIAAHAFENCDYIERITLTDATNLKVIPRFAFFDCDKLTRINLPTSIEVIWNQAFQKIIPPTDKALLTVFIPGSSVTIDREAFMHGEQGNRNTIRTYLREPRTTAHSFALVYEVNLDLIEGYFFEFYDWNLKPIGMPQHIELNVDLGEVFGVTPKSIPFPPHPGRDPNWRPGWIINDLRPWEPNLTQATESREFIAQYVDINASNIRLVTFTCADCGASLGNPNPQQVDIVNQPNAQPPDISNHTHVGKVFSHWSPKDAWMDVDRDRDIMAVFIPVASPGSSPSPSPSPSSGVDETGTFTVSISGGAIEGGANRFAPGAIVKISAFAGTGGRVFDRWETSSTGVTFLDERSAITIFHMPSTNVHVSATYKAGLSSSTGGGGAQNNESGPGSGSGGGGGGGGTVTRTNASVEITRPGIPNHELVSASVSGSLDNFVIKISDSQAATDAVLSALTRHFGDLSNIVYFPMNIELFDASGLHKITDTTGLTITITMPLPANLLQYGASNKVASAKGGILEHLNPRFSSIDGVPCVTFSTTHFSPYVIYADLDNLIPGTIDDTPKTGDGIHPKWLFVIGLVSLSMILFLKRERMPKLKTT